MKRLTIALALLFFAAGCSMSEAPNTDNAQMENSSQLVQETNSSKNEEDLGSVPEEKLESATVIADQTDYPELDFIQETVSLENLEGYLVTDNPGTRVIIFVAEGEQAYKSIFVKTENQVKLIDLRANELMMNEIINE